MIRLLSFVFFFKGLKKKTHTFSGVVRSIRSIAKIHIPIFKLRCEEIIYMITVVRTIEVMSSHTTCTYCLVNTCTYYGDFKTTREQHKLRCVTLESDSHYFLPLMVRPVVKGSETRYHPSTFSDDESSVGR